MKAKGKAFGWILLPLSLLSSLLPSLLSNSMLLIEVLGPAALITTSS